MRKSGIRQPSAGQANFTFKNEMNQFKKSAYGACLVLALVLIGFFVIKKDNYAKSLQNELKALQSEKEDAVREKNWIQFFYRQQAAALRYRDYGVIDNELYALYGAEEAGFLDVNDLYAHRICPKRGDGFVGSSYLYYGARILMLPQKNHLPDVVTLSYHGNADWAHKNKSFDTHFSLGGLSHRDVVIQEDTGLLANWFSRRDNKPFLASTSQYYRPFSYNSGDLDGDGQADFFLGDELVLGAQFNRKTMKFSGEGNPVTLPGESIFLGDKSIATLDRKVLSAWRWENGALQTIAQLNITLEISDEVPFALLPLPNDGTVKRVAVRLKDSLWILSLDGDKVWRPKAKLAGFQSGELLTGAFGDFTRDGVMDFWIAQPRWKNKDGKTVGRLWLLDGKKAMNGDISTLMVSTIAGNPRFTNYDGIGSTLSLIAGDIDGDGIPDVSFSGHRHMDEAGAMFILTGRAIERELDVENPNIIKIKGRPVSQLAPPFNHWDSSDVNGDGYADILVAADNDMCSGLNAGALYVLDGKRTIDFWKMLKKL